MGAGGVDTLTTICFSLLPTEPLVNLTIQLEALLPREVSSPYALPLSSRS
jgi:hypothetical protein